MCARACIAYALVCVCVCVCVCVRVCVRARARKRERERERESERESKRERERQAFRHTQNKLYFNLFFFNFKRRTEVHMTKNHNQLNRSVQLQPDRMKGAVIREDMKQI